MFLCLDEQLDNDYNEIERCHLQEYYPNRPTDHQYKGHRNNNGYQPNHKLSPVPSYDSENRYDQSPGHHESDTPLKKPAVNEKPIREKTKDPSRSRPHKHQHPEPTPEFPYQCDTCDMLFKTIDLMSDHQTSVHHNNRQFACRYCSKKFNDKYNMRKHVLIHVGEKRHKCQFCDKAFLRKDHLRSHLQTHYNRKFGCKICGKSFRTMELYQRHAKMHKEDSYMSMTNSVDNIRTEEESKKTVSDEVVNDTSLREDDVSVTILDDDFNESIAWSQTSPSLSENDVSMTNSPMSADVDKDENTGSSDGPKVSYGVYFF